MRFPRHKILIGLLLLWLPIVTALAFLQTPYVSDFVLQFALKLVRFKTGLHVQASHWRVSPFRFSATLEDLQIDVETVRASAPEIEIQISPLSLLVGNLHLRDMRLESPLLVGTVPKSWTEDSGSKDSSWTKSEIPNELGRRLEKMFDLLRQRRLDFDSLKINNFRSQLNLLHFTNANFEIENLDSGQARVEWSVRELEIVDHAAPLSNFEGSVALLRSSPTSFYLVAQKLNLATLTTKPVTLEASGKWPGEIRAKAVVNLADLNLWLQKSTDLKKFYISKGMSGEVNGDFNLRIQNNEIQKMSGELSAKTLAIEDYLPNDLQLKFRGEGSHWVISDLSIHLPYGIGDDPQLKNLITSSSLVIDDKKISGSLELVDAGHCGILLAASVPECLISFAARGQATFEGTLSPLLLHAKPSFDLTAGRLNSNPFRDNPHDSHMLETNPAHLSGRVDVMAHDLSLQGIELKWADQSKLLGEGRIAYNPTVLDLKTQTQNAKLEGILTHFLGLDPLGNAELNAHIQYSELLPKSGGRTLIHGFANISGVGIEGQHFGTVVGPIDYESNALHIGPLKLVNGGGTASIGGDLAPRDGASYLKLDSTMDRLEVTGVLPQSHQEIFRGFVTGWARLEGFTNQKSPNFISGPIECRLDALKVFGFPFQRAQVKTFYANRILEIRNIKATREQSTVVMKGHLNPESGSELLFSSNDLPLKNLGIDPSLDAILQSGTFDFGGWWRPSKGWGIQGKISNLKLAGADFGVGDLDMGADDKTMRLDAGLTNDLRIRFAGDLSKGPLNPKSLQVNVKDSGFYAAFAYLKGWKTLSQVRSKGNLEINWRPDSGFIKSSGLEISGPSSADGKVEPLLVINGSREFSWAEGRILHNNFIVDGPSVIKVYGASEASRAQLELSFPLAFLDLFVPTLKFNDGRLDLKGVLPLPPDIDSLTAHGSIRNGMLYIKGVGQPLKSMSADIDFSEQNINISNGRGNLGSGSLTASGVYRVDLHKPGISLQLGLDRAHVVVMDDVPADVTGELSIKGENLPYLLAGRVQIANALYAKEFNNETDLVAANTPAVLKFDLDMDLSANDQVKNSNVNASMTGKILLSGTDIAPEIQGSLNIQSGIVFAKDTEFKIIQSFVTFPGGPGSIPLLSLQATTTVKYNLQDYKIEMRSHGPVNNLTIEFSSDPVLSPPDIVNLLAFGVLRSSSDPSLAAASDLSGAARAEAFQALFGQAFGSSLDKTTGFQVRFGSATDPTTQKEVIPKVTVQRKLSDRITATFGNSLDSTKPETNFQVDYNLLNNVNLTGVWENSKPDDYEQERASGGVDLRFRFDVK